LRNILQIDITQTNSMRYGISVPNKIKRLSNMNKYKKVAINIAIITIILSTGLSASCVTNIGVASADAPESDINVLAKENSKLSAEKQAKILNAFENNDYGTWVKLVGQNNKINSIIDQATFNNFVMARNAARNGQYKKALKITESLKKGLANKLA